jgi:hypothetical protein
MVIFGCVVGILMSIVSFIFVIDCYGSHMKLGIVGLIVGLMLIGGSIWQYHYLYLNSDPNNTYIDVDCVGNDNVNVIVEVFKCIPIPYNPDKCTIISSKVVGYEDITSYTKIVQKAYNK